MMDKEIERAIWDLCDAVAAVDKYLAWPPSTAPLHKAVVHTVRSALQQHSDARIDEAAVPRPPWSDAKAA